MTKDFDQLIGEALNDEERELLAKIGDEPGYFAQAISIFRGPLAWVIWLIYLLGIGAFAGFVYAVWQFFGTTDPLMAIRWGFGALVLFKMAIFFKGSMGAHGEANRIMREIKRVELQLARLQAKEAGQP